MNITYTYYPVPGMPGPGSKRPRPPLPDASPDGRRRLPPLLRRAWYGLNQAFRRRIAHLDLTPDQYTVLRNLDEAGPAGITQAGLTERMTSDANTVASLVDRMERAGLLRRRPDPDDRRARRVSLARLGKRRFLAAREIAFGLQDEVLGSLGDVEREQFLEILGKLAQACRNAAERDPSIPSPRAPSSATE